MPTPHAARHYDLEAYNAVIRARAADQDRHLPSDAIRGSIPEALRGGTYLLNGPGLLELGGRVMHPFDGHGFVRALRFGEGGEVRYQGRFVDTMAYRVEASEGVIRYRGLGTMVAEPNLLRGGFLENIRAPMGKDVANTAIVSWAGRLLALWEGGLPHVLDPETLETLGVESFGSSIEAPFLAHVRIDHPRGRMVGLRPRPGPKETKLSLYEIDGEGRLYSRRDLAIPGFTVIHDFAITERYYVVFAAAMRPDVRAFLRAKVGLGTLIDAAQLDRSRPSTVYLIPREGGGPAVPVSLGRPLFAVHHASARDLLGPDGRSIAVVFDSCCFEDFEFGREFGYQGPDRPLAPEIGEDGQYLWRFRLDVAGGQAAGTKLSPWCVDFPRVHPERDGYGCRYVYGATNEAPGVTYPFTALLRVDTASAEGSSDPREASTVWSPGEGRLCGEPVFAPDPSGSEEDGGWLVAMTYDGDPSVSRSTLCILDAARIEEGPVAEIDLGELLPYGFHGNWLPPS